MCTRCSVEKKNPAQASGTALVQRCSDRIDSSDSSYNSNLFCQHLKGCSDSENLRNRFVRYLNELKLRNFTVFFRSTCLIGFESLIDLSVYTNFNGRGGEKIRNISKCRISFTISNGLASLSNLFVFSYQ